MPFQSLMTQFLQFSEPKASHVVYQRLVKQHFSEWKAWPTPTQIEDWHRTYLKTPHHANKGLTLLKAMFNWAIRRQLYKGVNPAAGIKRHRVFSRDRVMMSQEVAVLLGCEDMLPLKMAAMASLLLTTGARLSEARQMERGHLNVTTGQWYQDKTKNGRPHVTYVPTQTRALLDKLPTKGKYFFGGLYEHCWSRAGVEKCWGQVRGSLGLKDVRLHDFRRTFASHLYHATHDEYLVKRCINHVNPSVTAIYVRIRYEDVAKAMQEQADRFYGLVLQQEGRYDTRTASGMPVGAVRVGLNGAFLP